MDKDLIDHLKSIAQARLYFVHHSVGRDLLAGLGRLFESAGLEELSSISLDEAKKRSGPWFAHDSGGSNTRPKTKIDFFAKALEQAEELQVDLAFMKLCFVDFNPRTDTKELFDYYNKIVEAAHQDHPKVRIAHCTVPLTERPLGPKEILYRLIGREVWADASNAKRHEFNLRLLETYDSAPIFDIARFESTGPDGRRDIAHQGGVTYPYLDDRYTDDGGHLNALGQQTLGRELALFLAQAIST